jgi:hypothetical protein
MPVLGPQVKVRLIKEPVWWRYPEQVALRQNPRCLLSYAKVGFVNALETILNV